MENLQISNTEITLFLVQVVLEKNVPYGHIFLFELIPIHNRELAL